MDMNGMEPVVGDGIEIFRGFYKHWALYVGEGLVIHLAPATEGEDGKGAGLISSALSSKGSVKKQNLLEVTGTSEWKINNELDNKYTPFPSDKILYVANQVAGKKVPYGVIRSNCEHFVNLLRYGENVSKQVEDLGSGLIKGGVTAVVSAGAYVLGTFFYGWTTKAENKGKNSVRKKSRVSAPKGAGAPGQMSMYLGASGGAGALRPPSPQKGAAYMLSFTETEEIYADMNGTKVDVGDVIEISRGSDQHWALYVGYGLVIHLAPPSEGEDGKGAGLIASALGAKGSVKRQNLLEVTGTSEWKINNELDNKYTPFPPDKIMMIAINIEDKKVPYGLRGSNCEHFVNLLRYGENVSKQVEDVEKALETGGKTAMAAAAALALGSYYIKWTTKMESMELGNDNN